MGFFLPAAPDRVLLMKLRKIRPLSTRDGHAEADDAEVCGLMRICAYAEAIRKTKSVCAIVGKKKQGQK